MSMIDTFLKAVGFDPAEFAQACEYYKKEFELMKSGLQGAVGHFNNELLTLRKENIELNTKLDRILFHLEDKPVPLPELKSNGHDNRDGFDGLERFKRD